MWYVLYISNGSNLLSNTYNGHILFTASHSDKLFTAAEALAFDTKFDDGMPATGTIQTFAGESTCTDLTTGGTSAAAVYLASTQTAKGCNVVFLNLGF